MNTSDSHPMDPNKVIELSLNRTETLILSWSLLVSTSAIVGDLPNQLVALQRVRALLDDLGMAGFDSLVNRFERLTNSAFPECQASPLAEDCTHCSCPDPICCFCLQPKPYIGPHLS